ncbi:MAG: 5-guanidino-2-oxopentanoate decarboxylase [Rhodobacter sp.]|nr:5-guanidino-2-oxopentanoate decarboxylase [Rhodobacter sp.]MCA3514303.1 5-guanidino-2-oxopentanoate decarboxylase [Rhodobacter sp.]MCA3519016.1 5-guanidino-2-oxopentanoate decarboxylase [Rhodobacter sp.]MCA3522463.1 5-guanidino-2-oxopentanoate decarboxylase [Rhodobacter sp.]MCA3525457.1 5-guanidino-2-oxopentanoate decarboxylase [Rhodobacter sp.]
MRTVGQALVAGLRTRGVDVVFGIPGVHTIELYRGLAGGGIRHVTARHEQGAAFMADGYARVSGKPGVAFVITGPGLTNALTAMAQARADSVPVLVISGVNRRDSLGKGLGLLHELPDQAAMVRALCPSFRVDRPEVLDSVLTRAFAALTAGRPGPVHVEVPTDVMALPCAQPQAPAPVAQGALPDLSAAALRLTRAQRPVILAGGGMRRADAALRALAERLDAPVVQTVNARGLMHGHALTVPASPSLNAVRSLIAASDQVLALGTELGPTDYDMYVRGGLPDLSGMIRIDLCAAQLARHPAALTLHAEAGNAVSALLPLLGARTADGAARAAAARAGARAGLSPAMRDQLAMIEAMRAGIPGAIIVGDSTQPVYAGNLFYDHDRPGGWFNAATGYGALGFGTGAAVGAALASPGTPVICLTGDGGLQFSPGELRTALDERLPVTFVVWNNAGFQEIADAMADAGTEVIGCTPSPLNLRPFAEACDLPFAEVPADPEALCQALSARPQGPNLIEIRAG